MFVHVVRTHNVGRDQSLTVKPETEIRSEYYARNVPERRVVLYFGQFFADADTAFMFLSVTEARALRASLDSILETIA